VQKRSHHRTRIEALLVSLPGLECGAGNLKHLRGATLGDTLGVQITVLLQQVSTVASIPARGAVSIASLLILDYGSHRDLLFHPSPLYCDGEGWRGRLRVSTLSGVESLIFGGPHVSRVADPMIEALMALCNPQGVGEWRP
jgi:hypothetical protein